MNGLQTSSEWQDFFHHPRGSMLAFYNLSFAIGALAAVVPFPFGAYFADHIGRRWGIVCGNVVTIIGTILQAAAQNCEPKPDGEPLSPSAECALMGIVNSSHVCHCPYYPWRGR